MNSQTETQSISRPSDREWLLPFGNGGYASGTVSGFNSRSYHGLMVAALRHPQDRVLLLSHVDITLLPEVGTPILLACHHYGEGVFYPQGWRHLVEFESDGAITWHWRGEGFGFELQLTPNGGNNLSLQFQVALGFHGKVILRPFLAHRSHHGGPSMPMTARLNSSGVAIDYENCDHVLQFEHQLATKIETIRHENFRYQMEIDRGLGGHEDLDSMFQLQWPIMGESAKTQVNVFLNGPQSGHSNTVSCQVVDLAKSPTQRLRRAASDFLIVNPNSRVHGIIAGYPWFNEWGRDTMIALPGVILATGNEGIALEILEEWCGKLANGLLPNRLAEDDRTCSYNSADAPLWFVRALKRFCKLNDTCTFLVRGVEEILDHYLAGTEFGIGVDPADGLLRAGDAETQLTWMDACYNGHCFTPRSGKCVELNALLHEALEFGAKLTTQHAKRKKYHAAAKTLSRSFAEKFVDPKVGLRDCLNDASAKLRPNQLFALRLESPLIPKKIALQALSLIEATLLTPFGLRTLSPKDSDYMGHYRGNAEARDASYHQGTVWMWLMGAYIDAVMNIRGLSKATRHHCEEKVASCLGNLDEQCLGQLNEIFDGDSPHRPRGAPAQAWSSSELLRVIADWGLDSDRIDRICQES